MYILVFVYIYIQIYTHIYIYIHTHTCIHKHILHTHTHIYIYIYIYIYVCDAHGAMDIIGGNEHWVQILDEAVYISHIINALEKGMHSYSANTPGKGMHSYSANALGKGMKLTTLSIAMCKIVGQTKLFSLATNLEVKLWIQTC